MTFEEFQEKYCEKCGSQRCNPHELEWLEGCEYFQRLDSAGVAQLAAQLTCNQ